MKTFKTLQEAREWKNPDIIKYEVVPVNRTFKSVDGENVKYMVKVRDERFALKSDDDFEAMLREYDEDEEGLEEDLDSVSENLSKKGMDKKLYEHADPNDDTSPSSEEGKKAAEDGVSEDENPYKDVSNPGGESEWRRGHQSASKSSSKKVGQVKPSEGIHWSTDDTAPIDDKTTAARVMTKQNLKDAEEKGDGMTGAGYFEVDQEDAKLKSIVTNFIKSWDDSDADDYREFPKPRTYRKESGYYAPGTENDPDAPWNEVDDDDDDDSTEKSAARLTDYDSDDDEDGEEDEDMARLKKQVESEYNRRDNQDARWYANQAEVGKSVHQILCDYLDGDATEAELKEVQGTKKPTKVDDKASSKAVKERAKKVDKK